MSVRDRLLREVHEAPESLVNEVLDFVEFLKAKQFHLRVSASIDGLTAPTRTALALRCGPWYTF